MIRHRVCCMHTVFARGSCFRSPSHGPRASRRPYFTPCTPPPPPSTIIHMLATVPQPSTFTLTLHRTDRTRFFRRSLDVDSNIHVSVLCVSFRRVGGPGGPRTSNIFQQKLPTPWYVRIQIRMLCGYMYYAEKKRGAREENGFTISRRLNLPMI